MLRRLPPFVVIALGIGALIAVRPGAAQKPAEPGADYPTAVRPLLAKYCLDCHSTKAKKGSLDLERFTSAAEVRKDLKVWHSLIEQIDAGEMPPKDKPQPSADEKKQLLAWVRGFLDAEARARSGDPGHVPLRRLSNAEYDVTVRELTAVDLRPVREFPADGAAGEGFTNAAEALTDISPALLTKYLNAAKDIADHAVLLPDGFRFSLSKTRRDWTNEETAKLRRFYADYVSDEGRLIVQPYLAAAVRHRDALLAGKTSTAEIAAKEKLNAKYFGVLWAALTDQTPSHPLDAVRVRWRTAAEKDVPALAAEVAAWQTALWKTARIGSYMQPAGAGYADSPTRQVAVDPPALESVPLRVSVKPAPGQAEVVIHVAGRGDGPVVWHRPRFEGPGKPTLLLRDYEKFGPAFEVDPATAFANSAKYLGAVVEAANDRKLSVEDLAKRHGLDPVFLRRWAEILAVESWNKADASWAASGPLDLLSEKTPANDAKPWIKGWRKAGTDLPVLVTNASDQVEQIPGRVAARGVSVHPLPKEFVAVAWKSPISGSVRVNSRIAHAHPACGNGVAWRLEHRRAGRATTLGEGGVDFGKEVKPPTKTATVEKDDVLLLVVDAKANDHVCDMTEIAFTITEADKPACVWDMATDVANDVQAGNPHADKYGTADTWRFVRGASAGTTGLAPVIPPASPLGKWRAAAANPAQHAEAKRLAEQVQAILSGPRPAVEKSSERILYDNLVVTDGPLFTGVDMTKVATRRPVKAPYGLEKERFTRAEAPEGFITLFDAPVEIRLPAALLVGREFVVEARSAGGGDRLARVSASTNPAGRWDGPVLASPAGAGYKRFVNGLTDFRRVFPLFLAFPVVVPTDEVVSLKMFHREDEPLARLFLDEASSARLDRLWTEHRFVSRQPVAENDYLPQFIGFVTQDQPKSMEMFFESRRPAFRKRAEDFLKDEEAAVPRQLAALAEFAAKAYRRPLQEKEKADLLGLYQAVRAKGAGHDEAFRGVLARVFVAPAFLFRIEQAPAGREPGPVNDWELATRLSYFLWSGPPDAELRALAAAGKLRDPNVLAAQSRRMLQDARTRSLAVEFGTQWIHVRGFDELKEKNERLFPTFDVALRKAIYEESILFFQDLFQADRPVTNLLDADYTFLNDTLAKHYGVPGVSGPHWRKVDGMRKYGRGGVLGLASVQTKEAGASRTSPVLRGNWVVETLLGEKLPRPPANVPQLPEVEGADKLTVRQLVERHAKDAACATCHVRIDPYGFALERYDPIGRLRDKDLGGLMVDTKAKLKDGTEFEGIDGLRTYLLTKKKDVVVRLFCKRLLGYALGRSVTLSDTVLLDELVAELGKNEGRVTAAVQAIVRSPQFRTVRGAGMTTDH